MKTTIKFSSFLEFYPDIKAAREQAKSLVNRIEQLQAKYQEVLQKANLLPVEFSEHRFEPLTIVKRKLGGEEVC